MLKEDSPAYPLCVELAKLWHEHGYAAMHTRWTAYVEERKAAGKPVVLWEQVALAETTRVLQQRLNDPNQYGE